MVPPEYDSSPSTECEQAFDDLAAGQRAIDLERIGEQITVILDVTDPTLTSANARFFHASTPESIARRSLGSVSWEHVLDAARIAIQTVAFLNCRLLDRVQCEPLVVDADHFYPTIAEELLLPRRIEPARMRAMFERIQLELREWFTPVRDLREIAVRNRGDVEAAE